MTLQGLKMKPEMNTHKEHNLRPSRAGFGERIKLKRLFLLGSKHPRRAAAGFFQCRLILIALSIFLSVGCASTSLHQRGLAADGRGEYDKAVQHYVEHLKAHPEDLKVRNDLGVAYLRSGRYNRAFLEFKKVLIRDPKYVRAYYNIGLIYNFKGLIDEEIKAYQQALRIDPDHRPTRLNLAHVYLGQGKIDQAARIYEDVLLKFPDQSRALYNLALIYDQAGMTTEAITLLERLLSLDQAGIDPTLPRDQAKALLSRLKAAR